MREYFVHRSLYHLKESDPHAWAIPRLTGQAKASFVAVEFDEYGAGRGPQMHQQLFADLLTAAGLESTYLGYLEAVPAESLAVVNLMSLFGLHRWLRGAAFRALRVDGDHLSAGIAPTGRGPAAAGRAATMPGVLPRARRS
jgi:hypothetical protein